ncbi:MAG: hypothetical protein NTY33_02765 [Candidatus Moranbacteria bacterium]|nr:hypothetical protein [Candidatus Moranbacteria bacterium]
MRKQELFPVASPKKEEIPNVQKQEVSFDVDEFDIKFIHGQVTDDELKTGVKRIIEELWLNNFSPMERGAYISEVAFIYKGFERYEKMLLEKLNFDDETAYVETIKTLEFIRDFICSYEFEFISQEEFDKKTTKIKHILDDAVANRKGSYFLNLFAEGLKKIIENRKPYDEAVEIHDKEYEAKMEAKYGANWEGYLEEEDRLEQIDVAKKHYLDESHLPLVIAPNIYSVRANGGFLISQKKDFEKIQTLIHKLEDLPKSNAEIFEMEGGVGYDDYIDENQEIGNLYNEKIDRKVIDLSEKIHGYLKEKLVLEDLEIGDKDQSQESKKRNSQNFHDYMYLQEPFFRETIKKSLGVNLSDIELKEQFYFLQFAKKTKEKDVDPIKEFVHTFGVKGIRAFLSLEMDENDGGRIISLGEKLSEQSARLVFEKISQLTDLAETEDEELSRIVFKHKQEELPVDMRTELLRKAHQIILQFSTELKTGTQASEEKIQKLLADLEKSRIDIDIMASLLIAMKKSGAEQNVSGIKGVEMETVEPRSDAEEKQKDTEKKDEKVEKLAEMYRANNSHKSREDLERLLSDFETHKKHNPRFYLVYFDKENKTDPKKSLDNLVGFMRSSSFDGQKELPEGERYLGAMNIDPILQKFYFGENFLREIVEKEFASGTKKLIAHVPENGPSHRIVKLLGFEAVAEEGDYRDDDGKVTAKRLRVELVKE